jgi:hypothetical protein
MLEAMNLPLANPNPTIRMASKPAESVTIRSDCQAHLMRCHAVFMVLNQWVARGAMCITMMRGCITMMRFCKSQAKSAGCGDITLHHFASQ